MKTQRIKSKKTKEQKNVSTFLSSCFNALVNTVIDMDKRGVSEEVWHREVRGKTDDGKDIKVSYGYGVKVGLDDHVKSHKAISRK
jgi:hypothetical protein